MSNLYVAEATVTGLLGDRATKMLDRDGDGAADTGLLASLIEKAGRAINVRLRQRYGSSVPFAEITDSPATPEGIQSIATDLVLFYIFSYWEPEGRDANHHWTLADGMLTMLADKKGDIDVSRAKASEGDVIAVYTAEDPVFAGQTTDGVSRSRGI